MEPAAALIPLWIKVAYTVIVSITVAVYVRKYPLGNFLWFSDIALVMTTATLWLESPLLASMMAVGTLLPEIFWNVSFFGQLVTGRRVSGLSDYMFDARLPRHLRALSLFHVILPLLLLWLVARLGYDPRALAMQTALAWVVLALSYWLTNPKENVNWVFGWGAGPQQRISPLLYLALLMVGFPVLIHYPTHLVLQKFYG
jgi:hypothetical protein